MARSKSSSQGAPLGQHFLTDHRLQQKIIAAVQPSPDSVVLEIGGGPGNMTRLLAESGARVISVEIDPKLAENLRKQFADDQRDDRRRVETLTGDILEVNIEEIASRMGGARLTVFGNLPYYITSAILMKLFTAHEVIERIVAMMQYEVARRTVAAPGEAEYGLLSVTSQYYTQPRLLFPIPAGAFSPPPKVLSALVSMPVAVQKQALTIQDEADFWRWMRAAFASKRKTLVNNWKSLAPAPMVIEQIVAEGFDPRVRAEALSLSELAALYRRCRSR